MKHIASLQLFLGKMCLLFLFILCMHVLLSTGKRCNLYLHFCLLTVPAHAIGFQEVFTALLSIDKSDIVVIIITSNLSYHKICMS